MKPVDKNFFSSLKQVEKRLKLDDGNPPSQTTVTPPSQSSPLFFHTPTISSTHNSPSQPAQEFLSHNDTNSCLSNPSHSEHGGVVYDIELMMKVLKLDGEGPKMPEIVDEEFYDKIVKVKGVKCRKEVERLDGWIKYFLNCNNGGKVLEPFRLAHLVLAKAAFVSGGGDGDGIEFPSTVDEFLQHDPHSD